MKHNLQSSLDVKSNNNNNNNRQQKFLIRFLRRNVFLFSLIFIFIVFSSYCFFSLSTSNANRKKKSINDYHYLSETGMHKQKDARAAMQGGGLAQKKKYDPFYYYYHSNRHYDLHEHQDKHKWISSNNKKAEEESIHFLKSFIDEGYEDELELQKWQSRHDIPSFVRLRSFLFSQAEDLWPANYSTLVIRNEDGLLLDNTDNNNNNNNNNSVFNISEVTILTADDIIIRHSRFREHTRGRFEKELQDHVKLIEQQAKLIGVPQGEKEQEEEKDERSPLRNETIPAASSLSLEHILISKCLTKYLFSYHQYLFQDHGLAVLFVETLAVQMLKTTTQQIIDNDYKKKKNDTSSSSGGGNIVYRVHPPPNQFYASKRVHFVELCAPPSSSRSLRGDTDTVKEAQRMLTHHYFPFLFLTFPDFLYHTVYADGGEEKQHRNEQRKEEATATTAAAAVLHALPAFHALNFADEPSSFLNTTDGSGRSRRLHTPLPFSVHSTHTAIVQSNHSSGKSVYRSPTEPDKLPPTNSEEKQTEEEKQRRLEEQVRGHQTGELARRLCTNHNFCRKNDDYYYYFHFDYLYQRLLPRQFENQSAPEALLDSHFLLETQAAFENFLRRELLGMCARGEAPPQDETSSGTCSRFGSRRATFMVELPNPFVAVPSSFVAPSAAYAAEEAEEGRRRDEKLRLIAGALKRWYAPAADAEITSATATKSEGPHLNLASNDAHAAYTSPYHYHKELPNQKYNFDTFLEQVLSIIIYRRPPQHTPKEDKEDLFYVRVPSFNETKKALARNWRVTLLSRVFGAYRTDGRRQDGVKDVYVFERELEVLD